VRDDVGVADDGIGLDRKVEATRRVPQHVDRKVGDAPVESRDISNQL